MYDQKQKSLNKRRIQRRMLNRWENEGGAIASGDPGPLVHDKHPHQPNSAKQYNRHKG